MNYAEESLKKHYEWKGKLETVPKMKIENRDDLSLAYTPGVAQACLEIQKDPEKSYQLTGRGNLVAVVTDGTAVLGLGDIGPEAGMPVMEGIKDASGAAPLLVGWGQAEDRIHSPNESYSLEQFLKAGAWAEKILTALS